MSSETVVATANVLRTLRAPDARQVLRGVIELGPDLIGLQEWEIFRLRLLHETGSVALITPSRPRWHRRTVAAPEYVWSASILGGCVVGARADRYQLLSTSSRLLSRPGRADRSDRPFGLEPPRLASVGVYLDRLRSRRVCLVSYHLVSRVQRGGAYAEDERPLLCARHRGEIASLQAIVDGYRTSGHDVYAVGDSNFDGMRINGLTSAWEERADLPGTHGSGHRKIDDVHAAGPATNVRLLHNASDHRAVVVTRQDR